MEGAPPPRWMRRGRPTCDSPAMTVALRGARTDDEDTETTPEMDEAVAARRRRGGRGRGRADPPADWGQPGGERPRSGAARLPGELVEVDDGSRMHVYSREAYPGEPTIVFLAGIGLGEFLYEFESVWEPLSEDVNVATVDYLGYGFSDSTSKERTSQNVATEVHDALHGAGVQGPYVLVAHSIGGLYGLEFAGRVPGRGGRLRGPRQHLTRPDGSRGLRGRSVRGRRAGPHDDSGEIRRPGAG